MGRKKKGDDFLDLPDPDEAGAEVAAEEEEPVNKVRAQEQAVIARTCDGVTAHWDGALPVPNQHHWHWQDRDNHTRAVAGGGC